MSSTVDSFTKGVWLPDGPVSDADFVARKPNLFGGAFTWPVMVARRGAIEANIATMAAYCARHGVEHAPHGKTSMAPSLFAAQLAAGAWGITVATGNQALAARRFGVPRVLLANEVLDATVLRWAAGEVAAGWEFLCYVDSLAGVEAAAGAARGRGRLRVLVELGYPGGRTGCRSVEQAAGVAAAATAQGLEVVGVAGFEGVLPDQASVRAFLTRLVEAAVAVAPHCRDRTIVSAGGSARFDDVIDILVEPARRHGWRVILRSGCYLTHDDGLYATSSPFVRRPGEGTLSAALQVWAQVLSVPEPGLALLGAGKRDLPMDAGLPVPRAVRDRGGRVRQLSGTGASIERLYDQHGYLRGVEVEVGDLVRLGISHPCTAFDRWRVIPVVDDDDHVVDLLHTYF